MTVEEDIEELWHSCRNDIMQYLRLRLPYSRKDLAEDVTQEVFVRALAAMRQGKGYTEHARGWLFRIAHNLIVDYFRAVDKEPKGFVELDALSRESMDDNGKNPLSVGDSLVSSAPDPHIVFENTWLGECLQMGINGLADRPASWIKLRMDGYENKEIAQIYGVDPTIVRAANTRSYVRLRERLQGVIA